MHGTGGIEGHLKGTTTELRFFSALQAPLWTPPYWYHHCRRATREEDGHGIDAVATIDIGEVPIQIKSSFAGLQQDIRHYGQNAHCVLIINESLSAEQIRQKAIVFLSQWRARALSAKKTGKVRRRRRGARR